MTDPEKTPQHPDYQVAGTAPFDIFPSYEEWISHFDMENDLPDMGALATWHFSHLPVWIDGNAYFNGASVSKHEKHGFVREDEKAVVELMEEDGAWLLKTNLYSLLGDFRDGLISSDTLGCAFEPEQRFESPDGSDILFNEDYFGAHRGVQAFPGPIEPVEQKEQAGMLVLNVLPYRKG